MTPERWPAVDDHIVEPGSDYEIIEGEVFEVVSANEPHGNRHAMVSGVIGASVADGFTVAVDMLTRVSETSNFAPDVTIYPIARDPETGGRQLERLAFEVVSTETMRHAGRKARLLRARGVRRVFAIDVENERCLEWSVERDEWVELADDSCIEDMTLAVPLPVRDLVAGMAAHEAIARAVLARKSAAVDEALEGSERRGEQQALQRSILAVLEARGVPVSVEQCRVIESTTDHDMLERWVSGAATCKDAADLLAG